VTLAALVVAHATLGGAHGRATQVSCDLWMVWDDVEDRNEFIALLNGSPYADRSQNPAAPASRRAPG
jgi:hypothetical protein